MPDVGAARLDRRPARAARRWRPPRIVRGIASAGRRDEVVWTGLILVTAVFAVLVVLPLLVALAATPYQ